MVCKFATVGAPAPVSPLSRTGHTKGSSMSPGSRTTRSRKAAALLLSGTTLAAAAVASLAPSAVASSHREAPLTAADPLSDNTDTYMFVSPDDPNTVTMIANWIPFQEPNGGPNFYPFGTAAQGYAYDINIDNNGDGKPDIIYRWAFSTKDDRGTNTFLYNNGPVTSLNDPNLLFRQTYTLTVSRDGGSTFGTTLVADAPVAPSNVGPASMPNYENDLFKAAVVPVTTPAGGAGQSYAGQADDPFFLDLRVFDLLYGGNLSEVGQDTLSGYNVNTVVLKLPKDAVAQNNNSKGNPVVGMWSTTARQSVTLDPAKPGGTVGGPFVQVSRLGQPLVNEVIVPTGLKDAFNSLTPDKDAAAANGAVLDRVLKPEVPALIEAIYGAKAPTGSRTDIAEIFLTGVTTKLDNTGLYSGAFKSGGADTAPIPVDLNSQAMNADYAKGTFQPSEMLRLNMAINGPTDLKMQPLAAASPLGVVGGDIQGFPNGRRLADDVVDIELVALGGYFLGDGQNAQATTLAGAGGDGVNANNKAFSTSFPFIAPPNNKAVNQVSNSSKSPVGGVETGAGGTANSSSVLPIVSGTVALLLLGAGGATLYRGRRRESATQG